MVDEIYDRSLQAGRAELSEGIRAAAKRIRNVIAPALSAMHHFEWDAPWSVGRDPKAKA